MKKEIQATLILMSFYLSSIASASLPGLGGGVLTGYEHYEVPSWFKASFLDISDDVEDAKNKEKHVMLFIHQDDCPYCAKMIRDVFIKSRNTNVLKEDFDTIAINIRGERDVTLNAGETMTESKTAEHFGVRLTPTIVFLNQSNEEVYTMNGYRGPEAFGEILSYVNRKSYEYMDFEDYADKEIRVERYTMVDDERFIESTDLHELSKKPLMLIIEDKYCEMCDNFNKTILSTKRINRLMKDFSVVRMDAESNEMIITPKGEETTINKYVKDLGITYRPGVIFLDENKEIARVDGMLYEYHFGEIMRYVGKRFYKKFSGDFKSYFANRTLELLSSGATVNLGE